VLDILGEDVDDEAEARGALAQYKAAASAQAAAGLDSYVSVKPTHFGLRLSAALARELYAELLTHCAQLGQFARVEMEDASTTDATLALFHALRAEHDNVGIVLQARLFRTPTDIEALGDSPVDVRIVKGIYLEPAAIAHTNPQAIRDAYVEQVEKLFQRGHTVALATHDEHLAGRCLRAAHDRAVRPARYYFEVLMGVQEPLWLRWKTAGNRVRVYVPFGPEWRAYSQRRLGKNPEILRHVIRGMFR
jgi:proline dehydrogenase